DIDMTYRGGVAVEERVSGIGDRVSGGNETKAVPSADTRHPTPDTRPSSDLDLIIHPRKLAATVQAVPYHLTDITGAVRVSSNHVTLTDLSARHGDGTVRVSGSGTVGAGAGDWDLRLSGDAVRVDDEFRKALPPALASLMES